MPPQRMRPLAAFRAMRALLRNPDETARVFDVISALGGRSGERAFERFRRTETGARVLAEQRSLLAVLSDRERLLALPPESLGHRYAEFMGRERISAAGLAEASLAAGNGDPTLPPERRLFGARLRDMHDLWHVVTGYGRDLLGEASLLAFSYAQTRNRGIGFIVATVFWRARRAPEFRRMLRDAFRRGRGSAWLPGADWEALLARPLEEVRAELRVGPPPRYTEHRSSGAPALAT
ncbi:MAG TPA: Coq4 family protein [Myxococcota bacterium]|jgi:ubiquinone biosynthesis protein COQ4|nr:Coq4 family protein [Myxococcota bacterium]